MWGCSSSSSCIGNEGTNNPISRISLPFTSLSLRKEDLLNWLFNNAFQASKLWRVVVCGRIKQTSYSWIFRELNLTRHYMGLNLWDVMPASSKVVKLQMGSFQEMASGLTVSALDSGSKRSRVRVPCQTDSANHFLVGALASLVIPWVGIRLLLAGEERILDEWGKIRLFKVGPQVPPWRDRISNEG